MDLGLKDKVCLVTGGSHGIGLATALELAEQGCKVAICSRTKERIDHALGLLREKGADCIGLQAEMLEEDAPDPVMEAVIARWGTIHVLINNVGGGGRWGKEKIEDTDPVVWGEVYQKNAGAAIRFTTLALPFMQKQKWGRVITITSIFGREGGAVRPWFAMAKTAQTAFMKSMSHKHYLCRDNITFNSVGPGAIMIPNTGWEDEMKNNPEKMRELLESDFPMERFGTPEEVANMIVFLSSEKASLVNGVSIPVDGGQSHSLI